MVKHNDGVGDVRSQNYRRATVENVVNRVTDAVDPIDGVLAKVLTHFFSPLSSRFNLLLGASPARTCQSFLLVFLPNGPIPNCFDNKSGFFLFSVLLTSLQGLT